MILHIYPLSEIPIYTQISQQIIEGIAKGTLKAGQQLPSVRALAADLGINMHTVNKSYHELEKKGIIQIIPKSGAVVCDIPDNPTDEKLDKFKDLLRTAIAEGIVSGIKGEEIKQITSHLVDEFHQ